MRRLEMKEHHTFLDRTANGDRKQSLTDWQSLSAQVFTRADEVLGDPFLSQAEKRAILASWISDARAFENASALRQLDNGALVRLDDVLQALKSLDHESSGGERPEILKSTPPRMRRKRVLFPRWMGKANRRKDDDDDPPPCPAASAIPTCFNFVAACGRPKGWGVRYAHLPSCLMEPRPSALADGHSCSAILPDSTGQSP